MCGLDQVSWLPGSNAPPAAFPGRAQWPTFVMRMTLPGHSGATAPDFHRLPLRPTHEAGRT